MENKKCVVASSLKSISAQCFLKQILIKAKVKKTNNCSIGESTAQKEDIDVEMRVGASVFLLPQDYLSENMELGMRVGAFCTMFKPPPPPHPTWALNCMCVLLHVGRRARAKHWEQASAVLKCIYMNVYFCKKPLPSLS